MVEGRRRTSYCVCTFATADGLVVLAGQQRRLVDDVQLRLVVRVRRETVAAHLLADRQRVLRDVPVSGRDRSAAAAVVVVIVVDAASGVVVVRRQIHQNILHVDGHAERLLEYRRADGLVLLAPAQGQHDGAHAQQDQRGGRQHADKRLHHASAAVAGPVVFFFVRGCKRRIIMRRVYGAVIPIVGFGSARATYANAFASHTHVNTTVSAASAFQPLMQVGENFEKKKIEINIIRLTADWFDIISFRLACGLSHGFLYPYVMSLLKKFLSKIVVPKGFVMLRCKSLFL